MKRAHFILISILMASTLQAQVSDETAQKANAAAGVEAKVVDPTLTSSGRGTTPAVAFQFTKDEKKATAQIGGGMGSANRWGLTVSGPVSKSSDQTTLATDEGLSTGFNAELIVRRIFLKKIKITPDEVMEICGDNLLPNLRGQQEFTGAHFDCNRNQLTDVGKRIFDQRVFPPTWTIGVSAKAGQNTFDFTDPATFVDHSESHTGSSFAITGGRFQSGALASALYYVGGSIRHESAFIGSDAKTICTPLGTSTSTLCRDIAIGPPLRRSANFVQIEGRSFIGKSVGLAPIVTYETKQEAWSINLPIYLRNVDAPFNGGVNLGWDSKRHDVVVSLFVGSLPKLIE